MQPDWGRGQSAGNMGEQLPRSPGKWVKGRAVAFQRYHARTRAHRWSSAARWLRLVCNTPVFRAKDPAHGGAGAGLEGKEGIPEIQKLALCLRQLGAESTEDSGHLGNLCFNGGAVVFVSGLHLQAVD